MLQCIKQMPFSLRHREKLVKDMNRNVTAKGNTESIKIPKDIQLY